MKMKDEIKKWLPRRNPFGHKGNYGRIFILAGSRGMSGACVLTSNAALRSGAGLVTVGVPESLVLPLAKRFTEAMTKPLPETGSGSPDRRAFQSIRSFLKNQDVLAAGPGLSQNPSTQSLIRKLVLCSTKLMVIDADGLNAFYGKINLLKKLKAPAILTPHPGEFLRLFGGSLPKNKKERCKRALQVSRQYKITLVLKGHETVVASPDGKIYVNLTGNPGMATAGSGDVLTGMIAALLGQGLKPFDAAKTGVYLHGLAGDLAAQKIGEISLVAGDLIDYLPRAFQKTLK